MNLCRSCGEDFSSVEAFDRHRVGVHAYTCSEGLAMEPMREDGRRCLSISEIVELGWVRNERGRWYDPARTLRAASIGVSAEPPSAEKARAKESHAA